MARRHEIQSVTTAQRGHTADVDSRTKRYLFMMGIRVVCVILAIVVQSWLRWVFIAGAVVLPYLAVVVANARDWRKESTTPMQTPGAQERPALPGTSEGP